MVQTYLDIQLSIFSNNKIPSSTPDKILHNYNKNNNSQRKSHKNVTKAKKLQTQKMEVVKGLVDF